MQAQDIHSTIKVGETVKTIRGQRGVVFSYDSLMVVVIQIRDDNIYQRIGIFHHTKVWPVK